MVDMRASAMPLAVQSQFWDVRVAFTSIPLLYSLGASYWR